MNSSTDNFDFDWLVIAGLRGSVSALLPPVRKSHSVGVLGVFAGDASPTTTAEDQADLSATSETRCSA